MKFYCKKCQSKFDDRYEDLFEQIRCPFCKNEETTLNLLAQGIHPPEEGYGISFFEFEDLLEEGRMDYLKDFFEEEFNLQFSRSGYEYSLQNVKDEEVDVKEVHKKTQEDGKLQRIIYNIYYILLQGL